MNICLGILFAEKCSKSEYITFWLRWRLVLVGRITCLFISSKCEHRSGFCHPDHNVKLAAAAECSISTFASASNIYQKKIHYAMKCIASDIYQKKISSHGSSSKQSLFQCKICKKFTKQNIQILASPKYQIFAGLNSVISVSFQLSIVILWWWIPLWFFCTCST